MILKKSSGMKKYQAYKLLNQGCGNAMPDLSDLVPFHSGQVENFYLLVPWTSTKFVIKLIKLCISYFD